MAPSPWSTRLATLGTRLRSLRAQLDEPMLRGLAPLAIAVAFVPFFVPQVRLELREPLFSDTLVFQYNAWCLRHGLRLYRDFGTTDGPFINYLHAAIQVFAGLTDAGFRKADLLIQIAGSGAMGALLAPATDARRAVRWAHRFAWASMAACVWLAWYFTQTSTVTTEREDYYALFGLLGITLVYASPRLSASRSAAAIVAGAALAALQLFGKPTGVMYPTLAALCVALPGAGAPLGWRARARWFAIGCAASVGAVALAFLVSGSFSGYLFWCVRVPYRGNMFLFRTDWHRLLWSAYWERFARVVVGVFIGGVAAVCTGVLPARALAFVFLPPAAFLLACLQARGYDYHLMPSMAAVQVLLLVLLAGFWEGAGDRQWPEWRRWTAAIALGCLGYYAFLNLLDSHFRWNGDPKAWDEPKPYSEGEKAAGAYIKAHTKPDDWVFAYTNPTNESHVVLLAAERRTASPYYHHYWLDPVSLLPQSEVQPNKAELEALTALQTDVRIRACAAVEQHKPAAIAFTTLDPGYTDCAALHVMLEHDFHEATTVGGYHVYLPN